MTSEALRAVVYVLVISVLVNVATLALFIHMAFVTDIDAMFSSWPWKGEQKRQLGSYPRYQVRISCSFV